MALQKGKALQLFVSEVKNTIDQAIVINKILKKYATQLAKSLKDLLDITAIQLEKGTQEGPDSMLADATLYLEYFGIVSIAWQWLKQAAFAQIALNKGSTPDDSDFYNGKISTMIFFFEYELPKTKPLHQRLKSKDKVTLETPNEYLS